LHPGVCRHQSYIILLFTYKPLELDHSGGFFWLLVFIFRFFRIPHRLFDASGDSVVSPCDGTVVVIEEVQPDEYFTDKRLQLSIFMSPLNVHVNRNPLAAKWCTANTTRESSGSLASEILYR
jgi:phosphatidylserine decarboxylase